MNSAIKRFLPLTCLVFILLVPLCYGQDKSNSTAGCTLLKQNAPIYIEYERGKDDNVPNKGKVKKQVWLRLYNNTNCAMRLTAVNTRQQVKLPSGEVRVVYEFGLQDNAELTDNLMIEIHDPRHKREPLKVGGGDSYVGLIFPAGHSIVFNVPLWVFKERWDVAVPYSYVWETEGNATNPIDQAVHFRAEGLEEILGLKASRKK